MASVASGELNPTHRVKLFPLPFLSEESPVCSSPVRSARVRSRLRLMRTINIVTTRTIFTLNRLFSNDAETPPPVSASPPPITASASAFNIRADRPPRQSHPHDRDPQLALPLLHELAARVPSSASSVPSHSGALCAVLHDCTFVSAVLLRVAPKLA